jgi:hypothetical protein
MKLVDSNFEDCKIVLNAAEDRIENCRFMNSEIVARVPVEIIRSIIIQKPEDSVEYEVVGKNPHAVLQDCFFENCVLPKGEYTNNYFHKATILGNKVLSEGEREVTQE